MKVKVPYFEFIQIGVPNNTKCSDQGPQDLHIRGDTRNSGCTQDVTFALCYKGTIRKLLNGHSPAGMVITKVCFTANGGQTYNDTLWLPMWNLIRQIRASYQLVCIDAYKDAGININNKDMYYNFAIDYVHPNNKGGQRIAAVEVRELSTILKTI